MTLWIRVASIAPCALTKPLTATKSPTRKEPNESGTPARSKIVDGVANTVWSSTVICDAALFRAEIGPRTLV